MGGGGGGGGGEVPSLRNVAVTAPYMHDGLFRTLREVIDYYNEPDTIVPGAKGRDAAMNLQMKLSEQDKADLEAFLGTLTDDRFRARGCRIGAPRSSLG